MQQLDLEARGETERLEVAPGTVAAQVALVLLALGALEVRDDARDVGEIARRKDGLADR